jgi:glyoxylase-like metal-dependent hydrolase (beta-lactamase superfamily II)
MNTPSALRRRLLKATAGIGAGILAELMPLADALAATNPPPLVDTRFPHEIAEDVWIIPDHRTPLVPNIGIVLGKEVALVIDTGLGAASGLRTFDTARRLAGRRRLVLTTTHGHPEHTTGAASFGSAVDYIANAQQADYLSRTGLALIELFCDALGDDVVRLLADVELRIPRSVYSGSNFDFDLGGRTVTFRTWGTAHSPGDQVIYVPDAKVLFAGDLIEEQMFPIVPLYPPQIPAHDIDVAQWVRTLRDFHRFGVSIVAPGHGNVGGMEIADGLAAYLVADQNQVAELKRAGVHGDELLRRTRDYLLDRYPTWEQPDRIDIATRYFAQLG